MDGEKGCGGSCEWSAVEGQVVVHSTAEKQTAGPLLLAHQHTAASVAQRRMCELMYISVNHLCGNTGTSCS